MNFFGFTSQFLFAICAVPEVINTIKARVCALSSGYLLLWSLAEVLGVVYAVQSSNWYLLANYMFNIACLIILIYYKCRK